MKVGDIPPLSYHPVKVGIADAFVIKRRDTRRNILYRFFYIYSTINITKDSVVNNAAVVFRPLLSKCVDLSRKCSYLPHGRFFYKTPLSLPFWKFQLSFIHFFAFGSLTVPPPLPCQIAIPSVGETCMDL